MDSMFGQKLAELMAERGVSQRGLAKQVHYDAGYMCRIVNGLQRPSAELAQVLDDALDAGGELVALLPGRGKGRTAPPAGMDSRRSTPHQEDEVRRRAALQVIAALGAGVTIPPGVLETALSGIEDALGDPLDVAEWERLVADYDHRIHASPAGALIGDLTADVVALGELFKRRVPPLQQAGLLRAYAALSGILAIDFGDANHQRSARTIWNTAIKAADASGDQRMRTWTRGRAAEDAFFAGGAPAVVTTLADEAERIAAGESSPGLAKAQTARTCLAIQRGEQARAHARLADLNRTCEQISGSNVTQSVFEERETQRLWSETYAYVHLGDRRAEASLSQARALYPANAVAARSNLDLMESVSLVKSREVRDGLQLALNTLQTQRRGNSGARLLAGSVVNLLPTPARALPEAREIRTLTKTT
ncbi:helix-turn-helix protein [Actinomadura pelletieri DSM 43383]|uniref:Helix-turn-helix protein n=1 Tax=Actinomadura pelletieri DSM 43383 TaxID=1120940 RepID=A0A495QYX0_9ACTN|nr:helix-turn-helix transcriptional regulator [Actinomadura pelletieri]RKS79425.1 helix-turn-helix protein [Actinomadura pelletieri DSM 43383]